MNDTQRKNRQGKVCLSNLTLFCFIPTADLVKVPHYKLGTAESTHTERKLAKFQNNIWVNIYYIILKDIRFILQPLGDEMEFYSQKYAENQVF